MSGLSTRQVEVLKLVKNASDDCRGSIQPKGPTGGPFNRLRHKGLIYIREDQTFWVTDAGRIALDQAVSGKPNIDAK